MTEQQTTIDFGVRGTSVVEDRTHNPGVAGSIPAPATNDKALTVEERVRRGLVKVVSHWHVKEGVMPF